MKDLFVNPSKFFESVKKNPKVSSALLIFVLFSAIGAIFTILTNIAFTSSIISIVSYLGVEIPKDDSLSTVSIITNGLQAFLFQFAVLFIFAFCMKISAKITTLPTKYKELLLIYAYSSAVPALYSWFPFIGWIAGLVHYIYLTITAGKVFFSLDAGDSFIKLSLIPFGFFLLFMLLIGLFVILPALIIVGILGGIPSL